MIQHRFVLAAGLLAVAAAAPLSNSSPASAAASSSPRLSPPAASAFHCQVPCGIYGDSMRIDMLMEDASTIEKGMAQISALQSEATKNANQLVRWVTTKDEHASAIQETVASYWLAQRIKAPAEGDEAGLGKYHQQLALLHGITVSAMKCKQTTDPAHVAKLRSLAMDFSGTYFTGEDLEHIRAHHGGSHR